MTVIVPIFMTLNTSQQLW